MPLNRKEIRNRAHALVKEWQGETRENAEAKPFWVAFFNVFGINRRRIASFEEPVKKLGDKTGFIDLLWKGKLLIEHKSYGKDLGKAYNQALDYFVGLKSEELPRYVLVSDFDRFKLYDLDTDTHNSFTLEELPDKVHLFDFIAGYEDVGESIEEIDLNLKAAELLGKFHDALLDSGFVGHELEIFLVRILFCLFAEDTGIFSRHQFINYLINHTLEDGSDIDMHLTKMFQVLDKPVESRNKNLSEELGAFPYVNGHLFSELIGMPSFDTEMRDELIECAYFDWSTISPAIFGSLFQSVMDKDTRRNLGAHYTSEENILKLIRPLFLDELHEEFNRIKQLKRGKQKQLNDFQQRISTLQFLDPACGCGNFLIITYRELRRLELALLEEQQKDKGGSLLFEIEPLIHLNYFHGIELEEWPVRIAEVAMWLTQHQMNREFAKKFGHEPDLLPLKTAAHIVHDNALQLSWESVVSVETLDFIMGNPPFRGKKEQSIEQKKDMSSIFLGVSNSGSLDFVSAWYQKATNFIDSKIKVAFVSTNSIMQGEQVIVLWKELLSKQIVINFAHRTFSWSSEASRGASVHVVIVGFSKVDNSDKKLFIYDDLKSKPTEIKVKEINPYLIEAKSIFIENRRKPLCPVKPIVKGSEATDNGHLILKPEEKEKIISQYPQAENLIRPFINGKGFLHNKERWCLWLKNATPAEIKKIPPVVERIEMVRGFRKSSPKARTVEWANYPTLFTEDRQPSSNYLVIPKVSSERRDYIPFGYMDSIFIVNNTVSIIEGATELIFGILESKMHMVWVSVIAGRTKSDYQYSNKLVYNNFPWPNTDEKQKLTIEKAAQKVLGARKEYPDSTLADLYDPLIMPVNLRKAHLELDKLVDKAYRKAPFKDDAERIKFLFERYQVLIDAENKDKETSSARDLSTHNSTRLHKTINNLVYLLTTLNLC